MRSGFKALSSVKSTNDPPKPGVAGIQLAPIIAFNSLCLMALAIMMLIPLIMTLFSDDNLSERSSFALAFMITLFVGVSFWFAGRGALKDNLTIRETFVLTLSAWLLSLAFASLPLLFAETLDLPVAAIIFETVSGLSATGATAIPNVDNLSHAVNLWRGIMQWYGGIGIIVMAIAILPKLNIGGMQIFRLESSDKSDKVVPRAREYALNIALIYAILSLLCTASYYAAGMTFFDSVMHMMTTVSTGGMSSHSNSLLYYDLPAIEMVAIVFMILGSLPFGLYILFLRGEWSAKRADPQIKFFFILIVIVTILLLPSAIAAEPDHWIHVTRQAFFTVISTITTTGLSVTDHANWSAYSTIMFIIISHFGGCSGSTTGGLKTWRLYLLYSSSRSHILRLNYPRAIFPLRYGNLVASESVASAAFLLFFVWVLVFLVGAALLMSLGYPVDTAFSASASTISNTGITVDNLLTSEGSFAPLSDTALYILSVEMILGRLEIMTVLTLLIPGFWRR